MNWLRFSSCLYVSLLLFSEADLQHKLLNKVWKVILFSAYKIQHPFITYHPRFHSSLPVIQPTLPTYAVITTISSAIHSTEGAWSTQWAKKSCEDLHCFGFSLPPWSMDMDSSVHNHWFLITQTQKIGILQLAIS